jgi:hypothetical protein
VLKIRGLALACKGAGGGTLCRSLRPIFFPQFFQNLTAVIAFSCRIVLPFARVSAVSAAAGVLGNAELAYL